MSILSSVCRSVHTLLNRTPRGQLLWLNLGIKATATDKLPGFSADEIRTHFECVPSEEILMHVRLLVCPWHAQEVSMDVELSTGLNEKSCLFLSGDRLSFQKDSVEHRSTFPARPCEGFASKIDLMADRVEPPEPPEHDYAELAELVTDKQFVPDFSYDRTTIYNFFVISANVFAVTYVDASDFSYDEEHANNGVYFFSLRDRRLLRHINNDGFSRFRPRNIISRPTELWIETFAGVDYFGIPPQRAPSFFRVDCLHERMDPAFWMAGRGDVRGAIDFVRRLGIPLSTPGIIGRRNLLHYAAMEGHASGVRLLLAEGFSRDDIDTGDIHSRSALHLAVAGLHVDVVRVLIKEGGANPISEKEGSCLRDIGEFAKYRTYLMVEERAEDEIYRIVPEIVRLLIEADCRVVVRQYPAEESTFLVHGSILSCVRAVQMICEVSKEPIDLHYISLGFQNFRTRTHELSAMKSLLWLVREYRLDINAVSECQDSENVIISLADHGCAEVVIMAINNLGADPKTKTRSGRSLREVVMGRVQNENTRRILDFFDSNGI